MIRHPIFVVGMPRSGTTLLSAMLDAHSQIAISPETHFYTHCRVSASSPKAELDETWKWLRQQPGVQDMDFSEAELQKIRRELRNEPTAAPPDLLRALLTTYADRNGAEVWGEKTPDHLAHVPEIFEDFPQAVVLSIVRDPRDVCLSLRGMPWNYDSPLESAWKWRRYAQLTERYSKTYPSRYREVRYEHLLEDPELLLSRIVEWLGAPFEESMFRFHRRGEERGDLTREPWKEKAARPLDPANKEKWRDRMGPAERWAVQVITGRYLRRKGYVPEPVTLDGAFLRDLFALGRRTVRSVGTRIVRRWRTPSRDADDHRPTWMRRQEANSGDLDRIN